MKSNQTAVSSPIVQASYWLSLTKALLVAAFLMGLHRLVTLWLADPSFVFDSHFQTFFVFWTGFRFDLVVLGFFCLPALPFVFLASLCGLKLSWLWKLLSFYWVLAWSTICLVGFVSQLHYMQNGVAWRWGQGAGDISALKLGDLFFSILIFLCLTLGGARLFWRASREGATRFASKLGGARSLQWLHWIWPWLFVALLARGTITPHHLRREDAQISPHLWQRELILSPIWALDKDLEN